MKIDIEKTYQKEKNDRKIDLTIFLICLIIKAHTTLFLITLEVINYA